MGISFHNDHTASLGPFIQVLASGRPLGRIFHINNTYRFWLGAEPQRGDAAALQDEDFERIKERIVAKYSAGGRA